MKAICHLNGLNYTAQLLLSFDSARVGGTEPGGVDANLHIVVGRYQIMPMRAELNKGMILDRINRIKQDFLFFYIL